MSQHVCWRRSGSMRVQLEAVELESFLHRWKLSDVWPGGREDSSSKCWDETAQRWIGGAAQVGFPPAPQFPRTAQNTFNKDVFCKACPTRFPYFSRKSRKYCLNVSVNGWGKSQFPKADPFWISVERFPFDLDNSRKKSWFQGWWVCDKAGPQDLSRFFFVIWEAFGTFYLIFLGVGKRR